MKKKKKLRLALVGTGSLRGKEIRDVLSREKFPLESIEFFDPDVREEYSKLTQFRGEPKVIHQLEKDSLANTDLVFLAADKKVNRKLGALFCRGKFKGIDLSEAFNEEEKIPIVVSGVNDEIVRKEKPNLIANPHPVTIILSHIFHLILKNFGLSKAVAFVLQPVSAFEESGIQELANQSAAMLGSSSLTKRVFKEQIAFNLLSHTEPTNKDGFSSAERKVIGEIRRVLNSFNFSLTLSLVQVPVFHTYSIMTYLELKKRTDIQALKSLFRESPYFKLTPQSLSCPVSSVSVAGKDKIFIGQIKKEEAFPNSFWIWTVADNLTRGSALNALEIAKKIFFSSSA